MSNSGASNSGSGAMLTQEQILSAMAALDRALAARGVVGEICIFGGAVMVLAFNARLATKDVDAVFKPAAVVRELAAIVAHSCGLPPDWLNDGVKAFLSERRDTVVGDLPQFPSLRITMPTAEYLLAMKCMASRLGAAAGEADDTADIVFLVRRLNLKTPAEVLDIVVSYYPPDGVPLKTRFLVESLFDEGRV